MLLHRITDIKNGQCILAKDTEIVIKINEEEKEQENLEQPLVLGLGMFIIHLIMD